MIRKGIFALLLLSLLIIASAPALAANSNMEKYPNGVLPGYAIVSLKAAPLAEYSGGVPGYAPTMPGAGHKLDLSSPASVAYQKYLDNDRGNAISYLHRNNPQAEVIAQYSIVFSGFAVKLNGASMNALENAPGVASVAYDGLVSPAMDVSPSLIGAPSIWSSVGGQSNAGAGIKIGIIDTGIDWTHPFLTDNSLTPPAGFPKCDAIDSNVGIANTDCKYVSDKVIVAKVFETRTSFDAFPAQSHGTHVAGIAAGVADTCAPYVGCTMSGIAPKAFLGSYNVFPGDVLNAADHDIMNAVEAAVADGMDVLNLSLGGAAHPNDPLSIAVNAAVDAGVVVAVAAGNSGPGYGTVESPGIASNVITVGATTNPHFIGDPVTVSSLGTFGAAVGEFNNFSPSPFSGTYKTTSPADGCTHITTDLTGAIALIPRGTCSFSEKVRNAQGAGAVGAIIYNNQRGDPIVMAQDGTPNQPTIPAVMVSMTNGQAMAALAPTSVTISTALQEFLTSPGSADILASFSSWGPPTIQNPGTPSSSGILDQIKPDVMAPGVWVYSSVPSTEPGAYCVNTSPDSDCYAMFQGTSMATPHVAGAAAVLKQLHPDWSPAQIKSAIVNTAQHVVTNYLPSGGLLTNPMIVGGGRIDLANAGSVKATVDRTSVSFGSLPARAITRQVTFHMTSVSTGTEVYSLSVAPSVSGPSLSLSTASITLTAGSTASFTVTLTLAPGNVGQYYGNIVISGGTVDLDVPYWVNVGSPIH